MLTWLQRHHHGSGQVRRLAQMVAALALPFVVVAAHADEAQDFPARTVRLVVPAAPGGPIDAVARILADGLKVAWPAAAVVENPVGPRTFTRSPFRAAAPPDAYS